MKIKMYPLIQQIVESGIDGGWNRAHKHTDTPVDQQLGNELKDSIERYIMQGFDEAFKFEQEEL